MILVSVPLAGKDCMAAPRPVRQRFPSERTDRQWNELRLKASHEKDPFKLALILSQMAALAHSEQQRVKQRLQDSFQNYRLFVASHEFELPHMPDQAQPDGAAPADSPESISRFLKLAATALKQKRRESGNSAG